MARFQIRELGRETWPDFERIMKKHNGVYGGCWCVAFHLERGMGKTWSGRHRELKERLVQANRSHAALVYDGADVVGWCQFGPPAELPARMSGYKKLDAAPPDWRITCFFIDRDRRKEGVARAALSGALTLIAAKGGGTVDAYPIDPRGKPYPRAIWEGTKSMYDAAGFRNIGKLGESKLMMRKEVRGHSRTNSGCK